MNLTPLIRIHLVITCKRRFLHCRRTRLLKDHSLQDLEASSLYIVGDNCEEKDLSMGVGLHGTFLLDLLEYHALTAHWF